MTQHNLHQQDTNPIVIILSNRGPFSFTVQDNDPETDSPPTFSVERGSGGLVTALGALAEKHDVLWTALAMSEGDRQWASLHKQNPQDVDGIRLLLATPDPEGYEQYYNIIANPLLWFIQHQLWDIPRYPSINAETWAAWENGYTAINKLFAETIAAEVNRLNPTRPVFIFPQDYHLYLTPQYLREKLGDRVQIQPFIHIPWPGPDAWRILPASMRNTLLKSLLQADRIGFQTQKDAFNFVQTCRFYLPHAHSRGSRNTIYYKNRTVEAKAYPISIDVDKVETLSTEPQTQLLKSQLINLVGDRQVILRVDRIEPSKNILRGLEAYKILLENHPEYRSKVQMLALLVPSRMEVNEYQDYLQAIMAQAGMINANYSDAFWEPVRIIVGENYHRAIAAMQLYDILLVNPIADGMNLVAKEGVLVNQRDGALLLSEHAGAFYELGEAAISVSPFDTYGTAEAMHHALSMSRDERKTQADKLRQLVAGAGVKLWFYNQLEDSLAAVRADSTQAKKSSTPATPAAKQSASANTEDGVSSPATPTLKTVQTPS